MSDDMSKKSVLVADNGSFVEFAVTLGLSFGKVYYWTPSFSAAKTPNKDFIGEGLPEIEVVSSPDPYLDNVDMVAFPDVGFGLMADELAKRGHRVWGSKRAEELELIREKAKQAMEKSGVPVSPWKEITGIDALRKHLQSHKNQFVKLNEYRALSETFFAKDLKYIEPKLDALEHEFGPLKDKAEFIAEDELPDRVEFGADTFCIDGQFPAKQLCGIEIKDAGYAGVFASFDELPPCMKDYYAKMAGVFKDYGYRGSYADEWRIKTPEDGYMIDASCREPSPPGELRQVMLLNFADIVWEGSGGKIITPVAAAKYGAEAIISTSWGDEEWQPIFFPEKLRRFIKFKHFCRIDGTYYAIPQEYKWPEIGGVVGYGDTLDSAIEMVKDIAGQIEGYGLNIEVGSFDKAQEEVKKLGKAGINIFGHE